MKRTLPVLIALSLFLNTGCHFEKETGRNHVTLEVAVFEGGFGIDWHKDVARQYEALHPDIKINLWGDPRVDEKIKPRILRGDPPDLASCNVPIWKLIVAGKLYPLDDALDSPAYGQDISWRQSLIPGILNDSRYKGKTYAMPTNLGSWVCWYNKKQFRDNGWTPPTTWAEFMALCEKIKASGTAPLAFQGKYPTYAWAVLLSIYQRRVPFEKWYEMQDLKPGAFQDPEFIEAARMMQEMATKYYQPGALAMTHTESQLEWVNGRAAMVFCGLWLKNEMKKALPPDFEMACFPVPPVEAGKGDPNAIYAGGGENFFVFAQAKHPKEAADFLKYLTSMEPAHSYILKLDTLSPVKDSVKGLKISPELQSAVDIMDRSSRIFSDKLGGLYPEFNKGVVQDNLAALVSGKCTPEEFGQRLETAAEQLRRDPEIYKPPAMGVPK
ncbi:MAG: extracellular solute-binding protein [Capsulimonadales bacterium]|nr:extracellular solute-binding protein [Capsulimonadales bacterium]